jgi:serine phosphatase RsbU (regulator of sigma subunit)
MKIAPSISIYRSLLTSFLVVIVLLAGGLFAMTVFGAQEAVRTFSASSMSQASDEVETKLAAFFDPARDGLAMMRAWGEVGRLDFADVEAFNATFAPLLRTHPQITSVILADDAGREYMLLRLPDKWLNRSMHVDERGDMAEWRDRKTFAAAPKIENRRKDGYDPRKRPWYVGAKATPSWTKPYTFATTKDAGITASVSFRAPDGRHCVLGFDLLLQDISVFTRSLEPSANGYGFVLTDDGRVLGLPRLARFEDPAELKASLLKSPAELGVAPIAAAVTAFPGVDEPYEFESEGNAWWGSVRWFNLDPSRRLGVAIVIPEADLLGDATLQRLVIGLMASLAVAFAAFYAMRLARRYSQPIRALASNSMLIRDGDLEGGLAIETRLSEVRVLAETHDEMRVSLRTLFKLERDIQIAREIQQKTIPESLPELPGYEFAAWTFPADETGGDTFDAMGLKTGAGIVERGADLALFLLADATGHGVGPALSVSQVRAMLRMAARAGHDIAEIVSDMNEQLCADLDTGRFVTAWLGLLDSAQHTLTAMAAGQSPLLHYHAATKTVDVLGSNMPPLGVMEDFPVTLPPPVSLEPGDLFAVISDGIFEARVPAGDEFGTERVIVHLIEHADERPQQILDSLRADAVAYAQGRPQEDDQTAILIKRL